VNRVFDLDGAPAAPPKKRRVLKMNRVRARHEIAGEAGVPIQAVRLRTCPKDMKTEEELSAMRAELEAVIKEIAALKVKAVVLNKSIHASEVAVEAFIRIDHRSVDFGVLQPTWLYRYSGAGLDRIAATGWQDVVTKAKAVRASGRWKTTPR
jgi:hypothetical protein